MQRFSSGRLVLRKDVREGEQESLLSLFSVVERIKSMEILSDAEEGDIVRVIIDNIAEAEMALGADMKKGQSKTLMTLFWYRERVTPMAMKRTAASGDKVNVELWTIKP